MTTMSSDIKHVVNKDLEITDPARVTIENHESSLTLKTINGFVLYQYRNTNSKT